MMSKINLILFLALCLGFSSTLYAAQNDEVDDEKENSANNGQDVLQNISDDKEIKDDCNLYVTQFDQLGWDIREENKFTISLTKMGSSSEK